MTTNDLIGYLACALVLATFYQKDLVALRIFALLSNVAFIVYATRVGLLPIMVLHSLLLPVNAARLLALYRDRLFAPKPATTLD